MLKTFAMSEVSHGIKPICSSVAWYICCRDRDWSHSAKVARAVQLPRTCTTYGRERDDQSMPVTWLSRSGGLEELGRGPVAGQMRFGSMTPPEGP